MSDSGDPATFSELRSAQPSLDWIWLDGDIVRWEDAQVHVLSHGLHYGTGVFEGVRCYDTDDGPAIFRWPAHLERFYQSAAVYGIDIPFAPSELTDGTTELIRRQDLRACYIRPIAFLGAERLGIDPTGNPTRVGVAVWPIGSYLGEEALSRGADVTISSWTRIAGSQFPTTAKGTGPYVNSVLASREARRDGYDEAIMLNARGQVAEGPGENLLMVRDGELFTPGLAEDVLPGVTRSSIVTIARDLGYSVSDDGTISRGELLTADELFFVGTAAEVTPIRTVDDVPIGDGSVGPVTAEIQERFFDVVRGRMREYADWLTPVDQVIKARG